MMLINEIRVNPLTKNIAIISTIRRLRPKEYGAKHQKHICPFCPGNEELTPPATAVLVREEDKRRVLKDSETNRILGWHARIFPNKYPALSTNPVNPIDPEALYAYGYHEVLVEAPRHVPDLHMLTNEELAEALWLGFYRAYELLNDPKIVCVVLIKNRGSLAGASIIHTHMQIFALSMIPPRILKEVETFRIENKPLCRYLVKEYKYNRRIVFKGKYFTAVAISAPRLPYEVWIIPVNHDPRPPLNNDDMFIELASILRNISRAYIEILKFDSYNLWIHLAPKNVEEFHWHIEIAPSLPTWGGLEKSSDAFIIEVPPEEAAETLRSSFSNEL